MRYISVTEVAERLCISRPTARKRLVAGLIPGWTVSHGMTRVDRQVFEKWADFEDRGKTGKVG